MVVDARPSQSLRLTIDSNSFTPYYQQITDQVRALVKSGKLREGDVFLSEGEVAGHLGISKMPVRQAFSTLRSEGLLVIQRGKKPIIGTEKVSWDFRQLRGFSEEMRRRGLKPSSKVLKLEKVGAESEVAEALRLKQAAPVYRLQRLYYVSGEPVAVVTSHLPAALFPDLEQQHLDGRSLYEVFEKIYKKRLKWAEEEISAVVATKEDAATMKTSRGAPLLAITETTYDTRQIPIEFSRSRLRADRYTATLRSVR
jgi:GntR family transcriptional regulator